MTAFLKRHLPIVAAVVVLILGGAVAALAAGGTSTAAGHHHTAAHPGRAARLLQSAAAYIGVSVDTLTADLHSGKSLGQVAVESGKTEAGLVKALTATASSGVEQHLSAQVKRPGGLHARHGSARAHSLHLAAAKYLGISPAALRADLHTGKTLADVADSTPGHSSAGLIAALVASRETRGPAAGTSSNAATAAKAGRSARLRQRVTAFVERSHKRAARHKPAG